MTPATPEWKVAYRPTACLTAATAVAAALLVAVPVSAAHAATCVTKHGSATGITRDFAEYEAFLIIRQVTGNWPIETDRFSKPVYKCSNDGALWTCRATAKVCKG